MPNFEEMMNRFNDVCEMFADSDRDEDLPILFTLIDMVAGKFEKTGAEFIKEYLPMMESVGDDMGVCKG